MIDHESEIFHSIDAIEALLNQLHGMQQRAERFARVAEGHAANGSEYSNLYRQSAQMLQAAMDVLAGERATLLQLQIDAIELRRLNAVAQAYGESTAAHVIDRMVPRDPSSPIVAGLRAACEAFGGIEEEDLTAEGAEGRRGRN